MKVQEIKTRKGYRYILLDDDYVPVDEVNRFLLDLDCCGSSPNTLKTYAYALKEFYKYLELKSMTPAEVTNNPKIYQRDFLSGFIKWLQFPENTLTDYGKIPKQKLNQTINKIFNVVLHFFRYLSDNNEYKEINNSQIKKVTNHRYKDFLFEMVKHGNEIETSEYWLPVVKKSVSYITRDEYYKLYEACENRRDKILVGLLYEGGLRISEALGIHVSDLRLESNIIDIVPRENNDNRARVKNNAAGKILLPPYLSKLINDYLCIDAIETDSDYLFANIYTEHKDQHDKAMSYNNAYSLFKRLSKKTGIYVHPHMLRHGFAHEKRMAGWSIEQIQLYLRHKDPTSTELYADLDNDEKIKMMKDFLNQKQKGMEKFKL